MRGFAFVCIALLIFSSCAAVDQAEDAECTPAIATRGDIRTMIANPERWLGQCVTIHATVMDLRILADTDAAYQARQDFFKDSSNGGMLGYQSRLDDRSAEARNGKAELTGTMEDCEQAHASIEAMNAADPDRIMFAGGYCHTSSGFYFFVERARWFGPVKLERQLPARAGLLYGNIEQAQQDWPFKAGAEALARDFFAALRAGDARELDQLHAGFNFADSSRDDMIRFLLRDKSSLFARLRAGPEAPQMSLFLDRMSAGELKEYGDDIDSRRPIACFCLTEDCEARWPIRRADADNLPSRPYACTQIVSGVIDDSSTTWLDTPMKESGLIEPNR